MDTGVSGDRRAGRYSLGRVIEVLTRLVRLHGTPRYLRLDNGPEFVAAGAASKSSFETNFL
jgi:hypothetical protein